LNQSCTSFISPEKGEFLTYEFELLNLHLKIRTYVKAPEKQIPRGYKIGRIRSPGRLRDRRRTRDFTDDTLLTMNGAGCQLNKLEINSKFVLPHIQTESKSPMSAPQIPRLLEMDLNRQTIGSSSQPNLCA